MACQQCDELVTCCGIFLYVLMSHSMLAAVGMMENHESLRGDQATVCFVEIGMFSSCVVVVCLFSCRTNRWGK